MTRQEFRSLTRGDLVRVDGHGACVIEEAWWRSDGVAVSVRPQVGWTVVFSDIPEAECEMFQRLNSLTDGSRPAIIGAESD